MGSPYKKQRASLPGFDEGVRKSLGATLMGAAGANGSGAENAKGENPARSEMDEDEEL